MNIVPGGCLVSFAGNASTSLINAAQKNSKGMIRIRIRNDPLLEKSLCYQLV